MNMRFLFLSFFLVVALLPFATSCHHQPTPETTAVSDTVFQEDLSVDTVVPTDTVADFAAPVAESKPVVSKVKAKRQPSWTAGPSRQVYVTGYNAYGRLWGYVTLTGDQGTGVIHDAEENHYNIRCTRHGDELFAVDQNSRQYVLKFSEE